MSAFTHDELERIQRTLRKRYVHAKGSDVLDVGFGVAYKFGAVDPRRGFSAIFFVRVKSEAVQPTWVPKSVVVRLKRGKHFETITLPTDTVAVGDGGAVVPTGTLVEYMRAGELKRVTGGTIVSWRRLGASTDIWGVLTVGHGFDYVGLGVTVIGRLPGTSFPAQVIWKAPVNSTFDAAIVQVQLPQLINAYLITCGQVSDSLRCRSLDALAADAQTSENPSGSAGLSLPLGVPVGFSVVHYLPSALADVFPQLGGLRCVVSANSSHDGAFMCGTSGSCWQVQGMPSALQVAGQEPRFVDGFAQALEASFTYAKFKIKSELDADPDTFRIVAAF